MAGNEFGNTVCTICYEDLKPPTEFIQAIATCGHIFHGLCLQQWLEYGNANNTTCPVCKNTCGRENIIRLYFQSVGDAIDSQTKGTREDAERLSRHRVKKLQGKVLGLASSSEHQRRKLRHMSEELSKSKDMIEKLTKCNVERDKDMVCYKALLIVRTEELVKAESECSALRQDCLGYGKKLAAVKAEMERPALQQGRLGYRKKLAAVKSALDTNLDEKVNTASYGNVDNNKDTAGIPKNLPWNSRQTQSTKAATGARSNARRFTKGTYLKGVEEKFQDDKEKYYEIIQVVKDIEANKIEISDARRRVEYILVGHEELVSGFNKLMARNFKTHVQSNDRVFNLFLDLEGMYRRKSISKTEFYHEAAILLRRHPDMLNDFVQFYPDNMLDDVRQFYPDDNFPANGKLHNFVWLKTRHSLGKGREQYRDW